MVNKKLLTRIDASNSLQYHPQDKNTENQYNNREAELQIEIECPRCTDTMTLCSGFDNLYYFCQECYFYLYTKAKDAGQF